MTSQLQANVVLGRPQIRRLFAQKRHKGIVVEIARELGISHVGVSLWLSGRSNSARIAALAQAKALELLAKESAA